MSSNGDEEENQLQEQEEDGHQENKTATMTTSGESLSLEKVRMQVLDYVDEEHYNWDGEDDETIETETQGNQEDGQEEDTIVPTTTTTSGESLSLEKILLEVLDYVGEEHTSRGGDDDETIETETHDNTKGNANEEMTKETDDAKGKDDDYQAKLNKKMEEDFGPTIVKPASMINPNSSDRMADRLAAPSSSVPEAAPDIEAAQVSSRDEDDPEAAVAPTQAPQVAISAILVGPKRNKAAKIQNDPAEGVVLAQATRVNLWTSLCDRRIQLLIIVVLFLVAGLVVASLLVVSKNNNNNNNNDKVEGGGGPPGTTDDVTPSPVFFEDVECGKIALKQVDYRGTLAITVSGKTCQQWDAQFPHPHEFSSKEYPTSGLENNDCRNPGETQEMAWCYTTDPTVEWEVCDVQDCSYCGSLPITQRDYRGFINVTETGKTCLRWLNPPHHIFAENFPRSGLYGNYCRNPNGLSRAWCRTEDGSEEFCNVPACSFCGYNASHTDATCLVSCTHDEHCSEGQSCFPGTSCRAEAHVSRPPPYPTSKTCGKLSQAQTDYRGTLAVTRSGRTCQHWDSQNPHTHSRVSFDYPISGLKANYCRNPDGEARAWCFTTDPDRRWEYCDVRDCQYCGMDFEHANETCSQACTTNEECPSGQFCFGGTLCDEQHMPPPPTPRTECGTMHMYQTDYRGTVNVTGDGKPCQRWDSQTPHGHNDIPWAHPNDGLDGNYCRNPDGQWTSRAWCYTTDPDTLYGLCDVPKCHCCGIDPAHAASTCEVTCYDDSHCPSGLQCWDLSEEGEKRSCGTATLNQANYRGTTNVTVNGRTCQRWDEQFPHSHDRTNETYPGFGLEGNYCRNPDGEPVTWCYTTDEEFRWEFCDVPNCGETCGSHSQADYRGTINVTASGKTCQRWDEQFPHAHGLTAGNYPNFGIEENYCRNPDGEAKAWCYTTDVESRRELCDVPDCV